MSVALFAISSFGIFLLSSDTALPVKSSIAIILFVHKHNFVVQE